MKFRPDKNRIRKLSVQCLTSLKMRAAGCFGGRVNFVVVPREYVAQTDQNAIFVLEKPVGAEPQNVTGVLAQNKNFTSTPTVRITHV